MIYAYNSETKKKSRLRPGFTLIELMIAIVIIGLITGGSAYFIAGYIQQARRTSTNTTMDNLKVTVMQYKQEKGEYPQTLKDLVGARYLKSVPVDGWDRPFVYRPTPEGDNPYELFSYGPDGKKGGKAGRLDAWKK